MPSQYVNLMPEDQDFGRQRRSRPEQPDQHRPDKAAGFLHRTERLRDSASVVSPIEFTTGTGKLSLCLHRKVAVDQQRLAYPLPPLVPGSTTGPPLLPEAQQGLQIERLARARPRNR